MVVFETDPPEDVYPSVGSIRGSEMDIMKDSQYQFSPVEMPMRPWMPVELPGIGELRKVVRQRPKKMVEPTDIITVPFVQGDDQANPFDIPADIPGYMYQHLKEKSEERVKALAVPTLEKETFVTKAYRTVAARIAPFALTTIEPSEAQVWKQVIWEAKRGLNVSKMQKISRNVSSAYITHRKKLFYLDHAIHARRLALKKLRRDGELEERALKNFEWLVQFTQDAFDAFLKENDDDTMAAVKAAEQALKEKLEKMTEARALSIHINTVKTDILAVNESLKECKGYMKFLDDIARELMRRDELEASRAQRRAQQIKEELLIYLKQGMTLAEAKAAVKKNEEDAVIDTFGGKVTSDGDVYEDTGDSTFMDQIKEEAAGATRSEGGIGARSAASVNDGEDPDGYDEQALLSSMELVGGDEGSDRQELANLSFTHPKQLLDIYLEMEEQNLSLIQHAQHSEEALEGIHQQIRKMKKTMDGKARVLRKEINKIEASNEKMEEKMQAIKAIISMFSGGNYDVKGQEKFMRLLRKHVSKVFKASITHTKITNDSQLTAVLMLTAVEKQFEDLVRDIEGMPAEVVAKISRDMEKDRRENERLERMAERKYKQSQRVNKSIERARAPIKHKKGRPLFPRSRPPKEVINLSQNDLDIKAAEDEYNYYFGE